MKDLVEYIVKNIVLNPDDVLVEESNQDGDVSVTLKVNPQDMGIVIGKEGQTIKAIRKLLTVRAIADNVRVNLQLVDPNADQVVSDVPSEPEEAQPTSEPEK